MKILKTIGFVSISIWFCSCLYARFSFTPPNVETQKLRLNGFYYKISLDPYRSGYSVSIYYLYSNGVIYYSGSLISKNIDDALLTMEQESGDSLKIRNSSRNSHWGYWGIYKIEKNLISVEMQLLGEGHVINKTGKLVNDSIFVLNNFKDRGAIFSSQRQDFPDPEYYYFKKYTTKPDSTNKYIN